MERWWKQFRFDPIRELLASGDETLQFIVRRDLLEEEVDSIKHLKLSISSLFRSKCFTLSLTSTSEPRNSPSGFAFSDYGGPACMKTGLEAFSAVKCTIQ